ncbi:uncharacterized protein LOC119586719 [Penaeus monodon]|uniref:uncharacterized protein LOC119586719 n=1 Tax=Penaeus monodon TaxID=6687 RepID=UPI0018A70B92|nr:uncharacterized protein LOC119586719 [Penaeus monodon]
MNSVLPLAVCLLFVYSNGQQLVNPWQRPSSSQPLVRLGYPLQGPGIPQPAMDTSTFPSRAPAGPMGCGRRIGQGCAQGELGNMNCGHGTYVDQCNICQCAKGPDEICGGMRGELGRCTANLHCFIENEPQFLGKCISYTSG